MASEPQPSKVLEESQCQLLNEGEDCSTAPGLSGEECKNGTGSLVTAIFQQGGVENLYHKPAVMCLDEVQRFSRSRIARQSVSLYLSDCSRTLTSGPRWSLQVMV